MVIEEEDRSDSDRCVPTLNILVVQIILKAVVNEIDNRWRTGSQCTGQIVA